MGTLASASTLSVRDWFVIELAECSLKLIWICRAVMRHGFQWTAFIGDAAKPSQGCTYSGIHSTTAMASFLVTLLWQICIISSLRRLLSLAFSSLHYVHPINCCSLAIDVQSWKITPKSMMGSILTWFHIYFNIFFIHNHIKI